MLFFAVVACLANHEPEQAGNVLVVDQRLVVESTPKPEEDMPPVQDEDVPAGPPKPDGEHNNRNPGGNPGRKGRNGAQPGGHGGHGGHGGEGKRGGPLNGMGGSNKTKDEVAKRRKGRGPASDEGVQEREEVKRRRAETARQKQEQKAAKEAEKALKSQRHTEGNEGYFGHSNNDSGAGWESGTWEDDIDFPVWIHSIFVFGLFMMAIFIIASFITCCIRRHRRVNARAARRAGISGIHNNHDDAIPPIVQGQPQIHANIPRQQMSVPMQVNQQQQPGVHYAQPMYAPAQQQLPALFPGQVQPIYPPPVQVVSVPMPQYAQAMHTQYPVSGVPSASQGTVFMVPAAPQVLNGQPPW